MKKLWRTIHEELSVIAVFSFLPNYIHNEKTAKRRIYWRQNKTSFALLGRLPSYDASKMQFKPRVRSRSRSVCLMFQLLFYIKWHNGNKIWFADHILVKNINYVFIIINFTSDCNRYWYLPCNLWKNKVLVSTTIWQVNICETSQ